MNFRPSSDWLNPMLVRDLRQGLRSNRFTVLFLLLQTGMALFVVVGLLSASKSDVSSAIIGTLMAVSVLFYLLGMPLAATSAMALEFRDNRIDLLKLTQLSARSLIWGKWLSLVVQGLLVFTSLLPYLILTYFFGNVDIPSMLVWIVGVLSFNALLVGVCVSLSCFNSGLVRVFLVLALLWMVIMFSGGVGSMRMLAGTAGTGLPMGLVVALCALLYVTAGLPFLWLMMEWGASALSPSAENHDTPQRLTLLGLLAIAALTTAVHLIFPGIKIEGFAYPFFVLAGMLAGWVMMFASSGDPSPFPDTYRPFVRFGPAGKFIGRLFLYPGWPSATFFVLLTTAAITVLMSPWIPSRSSLDFGWLAIVVFLLPPAVLFPQLPSWLLRERTSFSARIRYLIFAAFFFLVLLLTVSLSYGMDTLKILPFACIFPPDALALFAFHWFDIPEVTNPKNPDPIQVLAFAKATAVHRPALIIAGLSGLATMGIICARSLKYWENFSKLEARAEAALKRKLADAAAASGPPSPPPAPPAGP